ncbi:hypothetical protein [Cupriavidus necator]
MSARIPAGPPQGGSAQAPSTSQAAGAANPFAALGQPALEYFTDAWQRTVLLLDILRQRGNESAEHEREGCPSPSTTRCCASCRRPTARPIPPSAPSW